MSGSVKSFAIVGAMRLCDYQPSFALAVATCADDAGLWLQVISPNSEQIQSFTPLATEDASDVSFVANRAVRVGDAYIHAFLDKAGGLHLDTASDLRIQFNLAIGDPRTSTPVKLAISEHMGDRSRTRELREGLAEEVAEAFDTQTARSFVNSTARSYLWGILEAAAVDVEALGRIRRARSKITAIVMDNSRVEIDLSKIDPSDLCIGFDEVEAQMQGEFVRPEVPPSTPLADLKGLPNSDHPTVVTILAALERSPRQEERLAILLRSLILYPVVTEQVVDRYQDKAQMARNAVVELRSTNFRTVFSTNEAGRVMVIAELIPRLVTDAYPRRRGAILYYLAAHLGDFPSISDVIERVMQKSVAQEVLVMRNRIIEALQQGRQQHHG